ncbi:MAG: phenylacetate--CoA ligase [Candidatus Bathyarchaeia archaeon]
MSRIMGIGKALKDRFWQPGIEKMSRKSLLRLQTRRLRSTVKYSYENSPFYRKKMKEAKIRPLHIRSLDDLEKIPFTFKEDFRRNYPYGLLAVPLERTVRVHASSGTTGDPTIVAYTRKDLDSWSDCIARCLLMTGVSEKDVYQVILGYGLFTGGLGFHYGAEKIGATVVPSSTGNTARQIKLMKDLRVTAFTSIPSYSLYLAETAKRIGIDPLRDLNLRSISCGAEVWSQSARERVEEHFGCSVFNSYGLSEICGPGVAFECTLKSGLHLWSDHFLAEIVDPNTGETLGPEEKGELTLTTLTKEAMPLLRYRTRDITAFLDERCGCGRTHAKIAWISGRTDDMIKVKGVNVFPSQIESALMKIEGVGDNYQIVLKRKDFLDEIGINVEIDKSTYRDPKKRGILQDRVKNEIESTIGIKVSVTLMEPDSLPRAEGKAKRILDLRS